ncbi:MAG TPA: sigma 54-interacting transcriptional regulator [Anaeromyxobacteraceae bacterium]|nr:sigma 54-interacting transcriptional regulator [Anaeromyxobacteraceae bacterium]
MSDILVVDDEEDMLETIAYNLERAGHRVARATSAAAALARLEERTPDLIVSDVMMPGMDGLAFCATVRARAATALTPFLFVTGKGQPSDKYAGLRAGADDYVTKPFDLADLMARVDGRLDHRRHVAALEHRLSDARDAWAASVEPQELGRTRDAQARLADEVHDAGYVDWDPPRPDAAAIRQKIARLEARFPALKELRRSALVGDSPEFLRIFEEILIAAASPDPTLILGETGTGKTAVAQAIWALGPRFGRPFRTLNCSELAAGDPAIATGKLFGLGSGSGLANVPKEGQPGILQETDGGVLFLDEVGDLPRQAQALLLLPLEGRAFHPAVGRGAARAVDLKFVCATNRDLVEEVEEGRFPRDLYERLAGGVIHVPPLRARPGDVALLAAHFLREAAQEHGGPALTLSPAAGDALARHGWPGNARELRRTIRQAAQRARLDGRDTIDGADLPTESGPGPGRTAAPAPGGSPPPRGDALRQGGFSEREIAEVEALCATGFRVGEAEALLGYSGKSRTFSHRLRGLSLKALSCAAYRADAAADLLTGGDPALRPHVERRLRALLESLAERVHEPPERILANLLTEHRRFALQALAHLRRQH